MPVPGDFNEFEELEIPAAIDPGYDASSPKQGADDRQQDSDLDSDKPDGLPGNLSIQRVDARIETPIHPIHAGRYFFSKPVDFLIQGMDLRTQFGSKPFELGVEFLGAASALLPDKRLGRQSRSGRHPTLSDLR